jgi:Uma2 family endonuclease
MSVVVKEKMSADEFLVWADAQEGRWELHDGALVSMSPERVIHAETKHRTAQTLVRAIEQARAPCRALPDGLGVRIGVKTVFEPDALVYCGPRLAPEAVEISNPVIVVEVLSPSTAARDHGAKLAGYFSLPSVAHYLILDPERRVLIHHKRGEGDMIETRILT